MNSYSFSISFLNKDYAGRYYIDSYLALRALQELTDNDTASFYGLDTETMAYPKYATYPKAALDPHLSHIRLIQVFNGNTAFIFDLPKIFNSATGEYAKELIKLFKLFLTSKKFVAHNAVFDLKFLMQEFGLLRMDIGCTYIMWKIIAHATRPDDAGLKASLRVLSEKILKAPIRKELQTSNWGDELTHEQIEYAALDAICTYFLAEKLAPAVANFGCHKYYKLCKASQIPIARMELNGIGFDAEKHTTLIDRWREDLYVARQAILKNCKLSSVTSHTIASYFEQNLKPQTLSIWPRTEEGKLSCDAHTLLDFADSDPVIRLFSEFQKKEKLTTSFGMNLQSLINPETRRIHANYNLCGARTGRLSCSAPNLQQLPRDKEVRELFKPSRNAKLLVADYSQIEIRVGAELSRDARMLESYRKGVDLHTLTGSIVARKKLQDVTKEDRQRAKAFNFGLMFGLGPRKFKRYAKHSYGVEVSQGEAEDAIERWRETYAGYRAWQVAQPEKAAKNGMIVRTPIGKARRLDPDNSYGASMNTPVQGGACECMLAALIGLQADLDEAGLEAKLCNCVHDEVLVECPENEVELVKEMISENMKAGFLFVFPQGIVRNICEVKEGASWGAKN